MFHFSLRSLYFYNTTQVSQVFGVWLIRILPRKTCVSEGQLLSVPQWTRATARATLIQSPQCPATIRYCCVGVLKNWNTWFICPQGPFETRYENNIDIASLLSWYGRLASYLLLTHQAGTRQHIIHLESCLWLPFKKSSVQSVLALSWSLPTPEKNMSLYLLNAPLCSSANH